MLLRNRYNLVVIAVLALMTMASLTWALDLYSIKIGEYQSKEEAESFIEGKNGEISPLFLRTPQNGNQNNWAVMAGNFSTEAEAWICRESLKKANFPSGSLEKWEWGGRTIETNNRPIEMPFDPELLKSVSPDSTCLLDYERPVKTREAEAALAKPNIQELTPGELYLRGDFGDATTVAIPALQLILSKFPNCDIVNKTRLRLARHYMAIKDFASADQMMNLVMEQGTPLEKSQAKMFKGYAIYYSKSLEESYENFRNLANDTTLDSGHRLQCMLMVANIAHKDYRFPESWLAFYQMEQATNDPKIITNARMQRAGLAFELVGRGVGGWDDIRFLCKEAEKVENGPPRVKSTARLMYGETFYKEGNYQKSLEEMDNLRSDFPDVERERATALFWKGMCYKKLGILEKALEEFEKVGAEPVQPTEMFASLQVKARALLERANILKQQGKQEEALQLREELNKKYPESQEAKSL